MESTLQVSAGASVASNRRAMLIAYWIATAVFCLQMVFTAYAEMHLSGAQQAFLKLGLPNWFRWELSSAKLVGIAALLLPLPPRIKEWAYCGFAIDLVSAVIAHLAMEEGPQAWGWAVGTLALWAISYVCWRMLQRRPAAT